MGEDHDWGSHVCQRDGEPRSYAAIFCAYQACWPRGVNGLPPRALRDATADLRAELDAAQVGARRAEIEVRAAQRVIAEKDAELAAAREDVARVSWLDTSWVCVWRFPKFQWMSDRTGGHPMSGIPKSPLTLRQAIDAARAAGEGEK